jgi:hypothetical protein
MFGRTHNIIFGRTHGIRFGRTLFVDCVQKATLIYVRKDKQKLSKKNSHQFILKWSEYLCLVKINPQIYLAIKLVPGKVVVKKDIQTERHTLHGF